MSVIKERKWFQPSYFPQHLKYLRGLNSGPVAVHDLLESDNYNAQLDAIGFTHKNVANSGNPNLPTLTADHKGPHRGDAGGAFRDDAKMSGFASDTYALVSGSLTSPITDEFSENYEGNDEWMIKFYVYLYQLYVDGKGITNANQYGAAGGYGRFNYWGLYGENQISSGKWAILREGLLNQTNARKYFGKNNQDQDALFQSMYDTYTFNGKTLYDVCNLNFKFYPNPEDGYGSNDNKALKFLYAVEKMGIAWPDRTMTFYTINYAEGGYSGIIDAFKGLAYKIGSGYLETKGWSHSYVPGYLGTVLGFYAGLLTKAKFVWDGEPLLKDDISTMDLSQFGEKNWIDSNGNISAYTGTGGQPAIGYGSGARFPTKRANTWIDGFHNGLSMSEDVKPYCTELYHSDYTINGIRYNAVAGSNGKKLSRFGVSNPGGDTVVNYMQQKIGAMIVGEGVSGVMVSYYDKEHPRGYVANITVHHPNGNDYSIVVKDNNIHIETFSNV